MPGSRVLIAYFSRPGGNYTEGGVVDLAEGHTASAARLLQGLVGGHAFRIRPLQDYPADYHAATEVARRELQEEARPVLAEALGDLAPWDTVFLGYPNWWGTLPRAVLTFLETHDLSGKTLLPFCTHEGSGLGRSEGELRKACPRSRVLKGLALRGSRVREAEPELRAWLQRSGVGA